MLQQQQQQSQQVIQVQPQPQQQAPDLNAFVQQMAAESFYINAADMGVAHYNWTFSIDNPTYPHSPPQLSVRLHLFVKYTHWQNKGRVKGYVMAETKDAARRVNGMHLEPVFILRSIGQIPRQQHAFVVKCQVQSYWDPPHQSAMVYGFEHVFNVPSDCKHEYDLLLDLDPTIMQLKPGKVLSQMDGRGIEVPPVDPNADSPRETVVVLKPLYNFAPTVFGPLVDRHVEYYQALGVTRHIIYLRKDQMPHLMLGHPRVARYVHTGKIMLVLWEELPEHAVWPRKYDQRVIYSHAALALSSLDMYVINIDLDEYLVTGKPTLQHKSIQGIIEGCAGKAADVRVARYNSVCKACERERPEALVWTNYLDTSHPLSWYSLVNFGQTQAGRSVVNPAFVSSYNLHYAEVAAGHNATSIRNNCMYFLHIPNMVRVTEGRKAVEAHYREDQSWAPLLQRVHFQELTAPQPVLPTEETLQRLRERPTLARMAQLGEFVAVAA